MATDRVNFPHVFFIPVAQQSEQAWQPRADVYRMQDGWLVKFELAGVRPDEIRLATDGSWLIVRGTRRDDLCCEAAGCHCMEIAYSRFQRALELPGLSDAAEIKTSYADGMLVVRVKTGADRDEPE